jgi:hypothetical protein
LDSKKITATVVILSLITLGGYYFWLKSKNNETTSNTSTTSQTNNSSSSGSGNIGTKKYTYKDWDRDRPNACNKDSKCKSFLDYLDGLMQQFNSYGSNSDFKYGYGIYMYDEENNLWFFSLRNVKPITWMRQLVPPNYNLPNDITITPKEWKVVTTKELSYVKKMCDAVITTDFYGVQSIDFNNNGCVYKIAKPVATTSNPYSTAAITNNIKKEVECAIKCSMIADGQQYIDCMKKCGGNSSGNVAIYKHGIGQYKKSKDFWS